MNSVQQVADYYDCYTELYLETTGDFIQAFRPADTDALMRYVMQSAGIADGEHWLDAGCGVGAASIWLCKQLSTLQMSGITISEVQQRIALQKTREAGLQQRFNVLAGDYHRLDNYFAPKTFDGVFFLESLGHSCDVHAVISSAGKVLKRGGRLYIKDFFVRQPVDVDDERKIDEVIAIINRHYAYNTLRLRNVEDVIRQAGFTIQFVRPPAIQSDVNITVKFEEASNRKTYPAFMQHPSADWFEILAVKES